MSVIVKIHQRDERTVVAVCDEGLLGQVFEERGVQLDLSSPFYQGEVFEKQQDVGDLLRNADSVNLVGDESIKIGLMEGIITPEQIRTVDGIPHAQSVIDHDETVV